MHEDIATPAWLARAAENASAPTPDFDDVFSSDPAAHHSRPAHAPGPKHGVRMSLSRLRPWVVSIFTRMTVRTTAFSLFIVGFAFLVVGSQYQPQHIPDGDRPVSCQGALSGSGNCRFDGSDVITGKGVRYQVLATTSSDIPDAAIAKNLADRSGLSTFVKSETGLFDDRYDIAVCNDSSGCVRAKYAIDSDGVIYLLRSEPGSAKVRTA